MGSHRFPRRRVAHPGGPHEDEAAASGATLASGPHNSPRSREHRARQSLSVSGCARSESPLCGPPGASIPCWRNVLARTNRYLNNIVEQDHRAIKRRCASMAGFKITRERLLSRSLALSSPTRTSKLTHKRADHAFNRGRCAKRWLRYRSRRKRIQPWTRRQRTSRSRAHEGPTKGNAGRDRPALAGLHICESSRTISIRPGPPKPIRTSTAPAMSAVRSTRSAGTPIEPATMGEAGAKRRGRFLALAIGGEVGVLRSAGSPQSRPLSARKRSERLSARSKSAQATTGPPAVRRPDPTEPR
jgi:hypothetical protein